MNKETSEILINIIKPLLKKMEVVCDNATFIYKDKCYILMFNYHYHNLGKEYTDISPSWGLLEIDKKCLFNNEYSINSECNFYLFDNLFNNKLTCIINTNTIESLNILIEKNTNDNFAIINFDRETKIYYNLFYFTKENIINLKLLTINTNYEYNI